MATVCCTKSIIYIYVSVACEKFGKFFLTFFHFFFSGLVVGIFFIDTMPSFN